MNRMASVVGCVAWFLLAGCGGGQSTGGTTAPAASPGADPESVFGPLDVGADYRTAMTKLNKTPWISRTHGGRFVNVYANASAAEAYRAGRTELPVGAVLVKDSFENANGHPGEAGPIFVMEKRAAGYAPDHFDWWYAIHWERPVGPNAARMGPMYWRGASPRANYCWECHDSFDGGIGGVPQAHRAY